jgi:hypothetical protein
MINENTSSPAMDAFAKKYGMREAKRALTMYLATRKTDHMTAEMAKDLFDAMRKVEEGK